MTFRTLSLRDGDIHLDDQGNLSTVSGIEALRQKILQKLRFFQGEWFLNINEGVPYFQQIFARPIDAGLAASIFNNEILEEEEVTGLKNVSANLDPITREFRYNAIVESVFGIINIAQLETIAPADNFIGGPSGQGIVGPEGQQVIGPRFQNISNVQASTQATSQVEQVVTGPDGLQMQGPDGQGISGP